MFTHRIVLFNVYVLFLFLCLIPLFLEKFELKQRRFILKILTDLLWNPLNLEELIVLIAGKTQIYKYKVIFFNFLIDAKSYAKDTKSNN